MQTTERNISTNDVIIDLIQNNDDIPCKEVAEEIHITRGKWIEINSQYQEEREMNSNSDAIVKAIAKAYKYSAKSIEAIIYSRCK